jgi:hypothetical protein
VGPVYVSVGGTCCTAGVLVNPAASSSLRKAANNASSIGAKLRGLVGPFTETVRSSVSSSALMMRPGRAMIRAIGERGPGALGVVVLLVVEVITGATLAASGVTSAVACVTSGAALADGLFTDESGDESGLVIPALPMCAVLVGTAARLVPAGRAEDESRCAAFEFSCGAREPLVVEGAPAAGLAVALVLVVSAFGVLVVVHDLLR